jgi:glycosyltransferase involved in cell wall biosynthesis
MPKQKILIIDNVFVPSLKNRILNGVQKFSKAQRDVLSDYFEVHYITMKGSDLQFENQHILKNIQNVNLDRKEKLDLTKQIKKEISDIIDLVKPNYVLDNSCKHFSSLYPKYDIGVVFEHYHRSSAPLNPRTKLKFEKNEIYWCGVSNWQNKEFRNYFDGVTSVHVIDKEEVVPSKGYGIFIGRWDSGKTPHIIMQMFAKQIKDIKLHIFTTINYGYLKEQDKKIIEELKKKENIIFHIDAPRSETLQYLKEAMFVLGGGKESTGIVSMEGASYGVPYIVRGSRSVAEQEHMSEFSMTLLDIKKKKVDKQLIDAVEKYKKYNLEDRQKIANEAYSRYNREQFQRRQMDLLNRAKKKVQGKLCHTM